MLKHLYKTFLVSILSGSLLMLQSSVAFAEANIISSSVTTDSTGIKTSKKSYHFEGVNDKDMLASLVMLGGGFVAGRMLATYKKPTTDVMIAAAGGAAFIAGEIMTNLKFKGTIDEMTIEVEKKTDGTINEEQVQRLQDLKKSYEEARSTTKTKKMLQLGAGAAFGAAAAMAGYMNYKEYLASKACQASILKLKQTKNLGCEATSAADIEKHSFEYDIFEKTRLKPGPSGVKQSQFLLREGTLLKPVVCTPPPSIASGLASSGILAAHKISLEGVIEVNTNCKKAVTEISSNAVFSYDLTKWKESFNSKLFNEIFKMNIVQNKPVLNTTEALSFAEKFVDLIFPKAEAGWTSLLGFGVSTAVAFWAITITVAATVDIWMFAPFNRMIVFGTLAGTSVMAAKSSDNTIAKLDGNIKAIDNILADINKMANGVKAQNMAQQQVAIQTVDPLSYQNTAITSSANSKTPCMTSNSSENCASLENQLKNMPGISDLPDSFKGIASQVGSLGDGVSGTNMLSGSTLSTAATLGSQQNAIGKVLKAQQDKYEKIPGNKDAVQKAENKFLDDVTKGVRDSLRKEGMTATGMMASIGGTVLDSSLKDKALVPVEAPKTPAAPANAIDIAAKGDKKEKDETLKLEFKEEPVTENFLGAIPSGQKKDYDVKTNEIGKDDGPSIFELISARYFKSGYPKLLDVDDKPKE